MDSQPPGLAAPGARSYGTEMVEKAKSQTELVYDEQYYLKNGCGPIPYARDEPHWLRFFDMIADQIILSLSPKRVFDAGCAMGFLVESLWDRGVEAWGVDISEYAISRVRKDMAPSAASVCLRIRVRGNSI